MFFLRIFISLTLLFASIPRLIADSTSVQNRKLNLNLSGSMLSLGNWKGETMKSISFTSISEYYSSGTINSMQQIVTAKSELGYVFIVDSLWMKQADAFNIKYFLKVQQKIVTQSFNAQFSSQFLKTYAYRTDPISGKLKKIWMGNFLNPGTIELGYGFNVVFQSKNMFNLSIASARFRTTPISANNEIKPKSGVIGKIDRGWLLFDYGLSGQYLVTKKFSSAVEWNGTGKVFLGGLVKESVQFDMNNTLSYKLLKYLEMRADVKWAYDPVVSFKTQYRSEFLLGLVYKHEKNKSKEDMKNTNEK